MDSKKDIKLAREVFVKGISRAAFNKNPKLEQILTFIVEQLNEKFPEDDFNNKKLN